MSRCEYLASCLIYTFKNGFRNLTHPQKVNFIIDLSKMSLSELYGPRQANLCLRAFRHDKFQLRMPSHSEGPGIWLSVWRFPLIHCLYVQAAKVLSRLRGCAGSPEPSLLAQAISTKITWRGPYIDFKAWFKTLFKLLNLIQNIIYPSSSLEPVIINYPLKRVDGKMFH